MTMQTTHTPGPWTYQASAGDHDWLVYSENSDARDIAIVRRFHEANAALIAAAPDLLAALQAIMGDPDAVDHILHLDAVAADAAIAKATGGEA
jgi:phage tail protein X